MAASTLWASLALSLAAATVLIAGFFGTAGEVGALCALILAAGLVAPTANRPGAVIPNWWPVLVTGTLMVAVGLAVKLGLNHPMGPLELSDYIGLDTMLLIAESMTDALGERFRAPQTLRKLVEAGHLGRKTGRGFFEYEGS